MVYEKSTADEGEMTMIAKRAASEGMVLLENRNEVLPLESNKVALFGGGAYATVKGGVGSGHVSTAYEISVYQGLLNAGVNITSEYWLDKYALEYNRIQKEDSTLSEIDRMWSGKSIHLPDSKLTMADLTAASEADTAIYVISRVAGEGSDRLAIKGDYYITDIERNNLILLTTRFKKIIVVLNTTVMDTKFFREIEGLDALLVMSLAGMEGGNALAEILTGKVTPSGKLSDTWAHRYEDYPASATFGANSDTSKEQNYEEGIYVGYRYFDSFNIQPAYEFGYGQSYTRFSIRVDAVKVADDNVVVQTTVTNIGTKYVGKEVVQIYFSAPKGKLEKPYQSLLGFGKTDKLKPTESQTLIISFPVSEMASYSEELAAWILEEGQYMIRVGHSSRKTKVAAIIRLDQTVITEQLSNRLSLDQKYQEISATRVKPYCYFGETDEILAAPVIKLQADSIYTRNSASTVNTSVVTTYLQEGSNYVSRFTAGSQYANHSYSEKFEYVSKIENPKLYDVYNGTLSMEQFVAQLDIPTLATLINGIHSASDYQIEVTETIEKAEVTLGSGASSSTPNFVQTLGIPNNHWMDGPAGVFIGEHNSRAVAYPVGMLLAQTWDRELMMEVGRALGKDVRDSNLTVVLGPGMNIHRDPLGGRNFEYFSEDPYLTGVMGAMITLGIQSHPGIGVSVKHFAANNQETDRWDGNSSVSERAMREIYLKGFEIAIKSAQPMTVMSSYNKINGIHASSSIDLITHILRGEWGFKGLVMTDWYTASDSGQDMHAGNDMIMGGWHISRLINAVTAPEPVFKSDGSIEEMITSLFDGKKIERIESWNGFKLDSHGSDICSTMVAADIKTGNKVLELVEKNIANVVENGDGYKIVTYKGNYKDAYTALGDLQQSVIRILDILLKCWTVANVYNKETGYKQIVVKPYSSWFNDLKSYLSVEKSSSSGQ